MGKNDMDHMRHLESVALSDCAVLQSKEATYQGSWKRAGGRSAWFMARRNLDRLITMMAPPNWEADITLEDINEKLANSSEDDDVWLLHQSLRSMRDAILAEDIFRMIAANPKGEDGTVLAIIRDARRYFMLVEAEMIAEGIVEPESKTYEQETGMYHETVEEDTTTVVADEAKATITSHGVTRELDPNFTAVISEGVVYEQHRPQRPATEDDYARAQADSFWGTPTGPRPNPGDGSHHASLAPWEIGKDYHDRLVERLGSVVVERFYNKRSPILFRLEPVVIYKNLPKELATCYDYGGDNIWILRRRSMPEELQDQYHLLQREMNAKEFEEVGDRHFMYELVGDKYTLKPTYDKDWAA